MFAVDNAATVVTQYPIDSDEDKEQYLNGHKRLETSCYPLAGAKMLRIMGL